MSTRDIFEWKEVLNQIQIISDREEDSYSDIPGWDGQVAYMPTDKAVCLVIKGTNVWFPFSQLRKAEDNASIYASLWILEQKDL
jgi:hypothetical protein